jgi:hypothetical protein
MSATVQIESARSVAAPAFRIAGFAGLSFALFVAFVNIFVGSMSPPQFDASGSEITSFVSDNKTALTVATGMIPLGVISLYLFIAGAFPRLSRKSSEAALWARYGAIGVVLVEVMFLTRTLFEVVLVANVDRLAQEPVLAELLWQLQGGAQIFTGLALALTLFGLSRAARIGGLIPAWQQALGLGAALAFVIGAVTSVTSLEGSPIGFIGLPAFVAWLVWLALTSAQLLRTDDAKA